MLTSARLGIFALVIALIATLSVVAASPTPSPSPTSTAPQAEAAPRAVLITGASSGIGLRTAEVLAANGFHVYAGARKQEDLDALNAIENITAIRLDVTIQEEIDAAVEFVESQGRGLYGLINNAGVAVVEPLAEIAEDDLAFQMDVNVMGVYRVTKAFAPMIIESKGRISTTGSISGFVVWALGGPYTMSKHAVEAYTDALAGEMAGKGVHVSVVEPGNYKSDIMVNMQERMKETGYSPEGSAFEQQMTMMMAARMDRGQYKEPDDVAEAFLHVMTSDAPKRRYMVVPNENEAAMTVRAAIERVAQLNQDHPYTFDREQLIEMLDDALQRNQ